MAAPSKAKVIPLTEILLKPICSNGGGSARIAALERGGEEFARHGVEPVDGDRLEVERRAGRKIANRDVLKVRPT